LASSRETSNGPDWKDLAEMLSAFDKQNRTRSTIEICGWTTAGEPDLSITAKSWAQEDDRRVAKPLALVNVQWRRERFRTMEGLFTYLLYQLDFHIAEVGWGENNSGA
jgi:hypothetical protein